MADAPRKPPLAETIDSSQPGLDPDATTDSSGVRGPGGREFPEIEGYSIQGEIARGGMGRVLAGRERELDREVAIKILLPGANARRFVVESRITARLPHPGIPPVYALGTLVDGSPYLAMKRIRGTTLEEAIRTDPENWSRHVSAFEPIAQAVGFAHSQGIVHRDLKPSNIMLGEFGEVQVMDWGLARELRSEELTEPEDGTDADAGHTQVGSVLGTPAFMAPEQARGEPVGPAADVFALGGILHAMLTGKAVFSGSSAVDTVRRAAEGDVREALARLDACPADPELIAIAKQCLNPAPASRPADGRAVAELMATFRAGMEARLRNAEAERAAATAREQERRKRGRVIRWAAGLVAAALIAGTAVSVWQLTRARAAEGEARQNADDERDARIAADTARTAESAAKVAAIRDKRIAENTRLFFVKILGRSSNLNFDGGTTNPDVTIREAIDSALTLLEKDFKDDPEGEADIRVAIAFIYMSQGEPAKSRAQADAAKKLYAKGGGDSAVKFAMAETMYALNPDRGPVDANAVQDVLNLMRTEAATSPEGQEDADMTREAAEAVLALQTGQPEKAEKLFRESISRYSKRYGAEHRAVMLMKLPLALCLIAQKRATDAEAMLLELRAESTKAFGEPSLCGMMCDIYLGGIESSKLTGDRGEKRFRSAIAAALQLKLDRNPNLVIPLMGLYGCELARGNHREALALIVQAETIALGPPKLPGPLPLQLALAKAIVLTRLHRYAEVEPIWTRIDAERKALPDLDQKESHISFGLAKSRIFTRKYAEAEPICLRHIAECEKSAGDPLRTGVAYILHLRCAIGLNDLKTADAEIARIEALSAKLKEPQRIALLEDLRGVGLDATKDRHPEFAVRVHAAAHRAFKAHFTENHNLTAVSAGDYANALGEVNRDKDRERLYREALNGTRVALGATHENTRRCADNLAAYFRNEKKPAEATSVWVQLYDWVEAEKGPKDPITRLRAGQAVEFCRTLSRYSDALPIARKRLAASPMLTAEDIQEHANARLSLGECLLGAGQFAEAAVVLKEALDAARLKYSKTAAFAVNQTWLAEALIGEKRYAEAEPLLLAAYPKLRTTKTTLPKSTPPERALNQLIRLYGLMQKPAEVAKWEAERVQSSPGAAAGTVDSLPGLIAASTRTPEDTLLSLKVAVLQAWHGRDEDLKATRTRALKFATGTTDTSVAERTAKICFIGPLPPEEQLRTALALAKLAVENGKNAPFRHYYWMALGMGEYRSGHHAAADAALVKAGFTDAVNEHIVLTCSFYRAMALFRLGKVDEAKAIAEAAVKKMRPLPSDSARPLADGFSPDDLVIFMAYTEAKKLIGFTAVPPGK